MRAFFGVLIVAAGVLATPAPAQNQQAVTVGVPDKVLIAVLEDLGRTFEAQTGIAVRVVAAGTQPGAASGDVDAVLRPERTAAAGPEQRVVAFGEGVLVGSRADRARLRGLRDIRKGFRWIAAARAIYVSSSPTLGLRDLELKLWDEAGVNVRVRSTWYSETGGDESAVFRQAAQWGAYALVQRATWAVQEDRRGLEILAEGDPALRTPYVSGLLRPDSPEARQWHDWLPSEQGQAAIAALRVNGMQVLMPLGEASEPGASPPRT